MTGTVSTVVTTERVVIMLDRRFPRLGGADHATTRGPH